MSQCLRITFVVGGTNKEGVRSDLQQAARNLFLEGTVQFISVDTIKVVACGARERMDQFLDELYSAIARSQGNDLAIEPFLKDRDYRGVFRVIE